MKRRGEVEKSSRKLCELLAFSKLRLWMEDTLQLTLRISKFVQLGFISLNWLVEDSHCPSNHWKNKRLMEVGGPNECWLPSGMGSSMILIPWS